MDILTSVARGLGLLGAARSSERTRPTRALASGSMMQLKEVEANLSGA